MSPRLFRCVNVDSEEFFDSTALVSNQGHSFKNTPFQKLTENNTCRTFFYLKQHCKICRTTRHPMGNQLLNSSQVNLSTGSFMSHSKALNKIVFYYDNRHKNFSSTIQSRRELSTLYNNICDVHSGNDYQSFGFLNTATTAI